MKTIRNFALLAIAATIGLAVSAQGSAKPAKKEAKAKTEMKAAPKKTATKATAHKATAHKTTAHHSSSKAKPAGK